MHNLSIYPGVAPMLASVNFASYVAALVWGTLLACLCLLPALRNARRKRLADDLPVSKTAGVFVGLVKLKGTAESGAPPFCCHLSGHPCVHYSWTIDEHWQRVVTETYTDKDGMRRTRQRTESGWKTVARGGQSAPFYLQDDCGFVLVRPEGAKLETLEVFNQTCGQDNPLYYAKGPPGAIPHSTRQRRFHEDAIPLHCPLYVIGQARERADIVAPEIAANPKAEMFLVSTRTEEQVRSHLGSRFWAWAALGFVLCWCCGGIAFVSYPLVLVLGWTWMVFNSTVYLRQRVRQAWSEVDVQLKRRADLIPTLVNMVQGFCRHETSLQAELSLMRSQMTTTPEGMKGTGNLRAVKQTLQGIVERYPELKANKSFADLQKNLVETEQRIALARGYFNAIATRYNVRLQVLPDRYIAQLGGMTPQPLMQTDDFERAPLVVNLDKTPSEFSVRSTAPVAASPVASPLDATKQPSAIAPLPTTGSPPVSDTPGTEEPSPSAESSAVAITNSAGKEADSARNANHSARRRAWDTVTLGLAFTAFLVWIGTLVILREPYRSTVSNGTPSAVGLISGFTAILIAGAAFGLRRKLGRKPLIAGCAVSLLLTGFSVTAFGVAMERLLRYRMEARAQDKWRQAQAIYNQVDMLCAAGQYDQACKQFEQAFRISPTAPYLTHLRYICACTYLQRGATAGTSAERFLNAFGWTKADGYLDWSEYAVLCGYTGYRQAGKTSAAKRLVDKAVAKCNTTHWPYPLLTCLHGEMDASALFSLVGNDQWKATDARTFLGIQSLYDGNEHLATAEFAWVAERGRKDLLAFSLAISELRRAINRKNPPSPTENAPNPIPTEADKARAQAGFNRAEMFWKTSQYEKVCDEFEQACGLYPAPPNTTLCDYVVACTYLRRGEAAGRFAEFALAAFGWNNPLAAYHVLYGCAGYRQAGNVDAAKQLLDQAAIHCTPTAWPYPLIACLRGEMDAAAVFSQAGNNPIFMTQAKTFVGIQQFYGGKKTEALANFEWVQQHGHKQDPSYPLAVSELGYDGHSETPSPSTLGTPPPTAPTSPTVEPPSTSASLPLAPNQFRDVVSAIVGLTKNGLGETVVLKYAATHVPSPSLTAEEISYLKANGVSQGIIDRLCQNNSVDSHRQGPGLGALDPRVLLKAANDHYSLRRYPETIDDCNRILQVDSRNPDAWYLKALSEDASHSSREAIVSFNKFINVASVQDVRYLNLRAYANARLKQLTGGQ